MSFVSRFLERIGVLTQERPPQPPAPPAPDVAPEDEPTGRNEELLIPEERALLAPDPEDEHVFAAAETLPPGQWFDPELTQRSPDLVADAEITESSPERTAIAITDAGNTVTAVPRRVTLAGLLAERGLTEPQLDEGSALAARRGLDASFDDVFSTAGLDVPAHGWTVERTAALVRKGRSEGMTPAQVRFLIEDALVRDGATPRDVAADAVAKDEALDRYEAGLYESVAASEADKQREADLIARRIDELLTTRQRLLDEGAELRRGFATWKERKEGAEREWADVLEVLAPFLSVKP